MEKPNMETVLREQRNGVAVQLLDMQAALTLANHKLAEAEAKLTELETPKVDEPKS